MNGFFEGLSVRQPRILLARLSHIGDCILTLPLLKQIRQAMPEAHIAWAMEKPTQQLLEGHPDLDEIIMIPKDWMHSWSSIRQLRRQLKSMKFDYAVDPQAMLKSAALGWLSGARYRIGLKGPRCREFSQVFSNRRQLSERSHLVDRSLDLLHQFGVQPGPAEFELPQFVEAAQFVRKWLGSIQLQGPFFVMNPGASWNSKMWENERFAEVADHLKTHRNLHSVIAWGGDREFQMAEEIVRLAPGAAIQAPATDLRQLAELLRVSIGYIGCDTGPMHLATAVGTRCIGLYGTTRAQDSGAYGPQHVHLQRWFQSGTCTQRRNATNDAMRSITVEDVCGACDVILDQLQLATHPSAQSSAPAATRLVEAA